MALSILDFKTWKSITKQNSKAVSTYFCLDLHSAIFFSFGWHWKQHQKGGEAGGHAEAENERPLPGSILDI